MNPKILISILFLTLALTVKGQQLPKGTFIFSTGFTYTEFTFKSKLKFDYKYSSCTGGWEGSGTYNFSDKELVLTFDNPKKKAIPAKLSIERQQTAGDTSYLTFKFTDQKDNSPISGVIVKFRDNAKGITYGTQSNDSGFSKLKIRNALLPLNLEINYIGIDPKTIRLDSSGNYSIFFPLNFEFIKPLIKGDTLRFIIDDFDNDELLLKPNDQDEFRKFKRKDE